MSADGRFVAFTSGATNLIEGEYISGGDVYVHARATGTTEWVSRPRADGTSGPSYQPSLSANGRFVAFGSQSALVEEDTNLLADVFVVDRALQTTSRVSVASDGDQSDL